jgi:hypothetical protein
MYVHHLTSSFLVFMFISVSRFLCFSSYYTWVSNVLLKIGQYLRHLMSTLNYMTGHVFSSTFSGTIEHTICEPSIYLNWCFIFWSGTTGTHIIHTLTPHAHTRARVQTSTLTPHAHTRARVQTQCFWLILDCLSVHLCNLRLKGLWPN